MSEAPARILVVEDDRPLAEFLRQLLSQEDYGVSLCGDGAEGLRKITAERPDLVLLDVMLPGMNGFEVCQRIRQDPATCLIPVILVTALGETKDKVTGLKLGADEYVSKPFDAMELLARIERTLRRTREALAASPLTGLPGRVALEEEIRRRSAAGEAFTLGSADLRRFAEFNRIYGHDRGDHVLRLLGMVLKSALQELAERNDLAAHLGGDDFAFIAATHRAGVVAARVLENAEALFPLQYDGHPPPDGPRLALAVGLADVPMGLRSHPAQLLDEARLAQAQAGAGGPLNRRTVPAPPR